MTGADIAYLCQRAAMCCVKDALGGTAELKDIAVTRRHFDASVRLLAEANATAATPEAPRLLRVG